MKKILVLIAVLSLSVLTMAAVEIEFWHAMGGGHGATLNEIVNSFNEANPDIVVKPIYVGNYGALSQKLLASAESGNLPAISQSYGNWTAKLIPRGVVQELNGFINNPDYGFTSTPFLSTRVHMFFTTTQTLLNSMVLHRQKPWKIFSSMP